MNRHTKRLLALAGSAVIGTFGAVALASPAQAHHPIISGEAVCQADGQYKITWTVGNGSWGPNKNRVAKITQLTNTPVGLITPLPPTTTFGVDTEIAAGGEIKGTQIVPGTTTSASLTVTAKWYSLEGDDLYLAATRSGQATGLDGDPCVEEPDPSATFRSNCDGTINVHIVNPGGQAGFDVTGVDGTIMVGQGGEKDVTVPAGTVGPIIVKKGDDKIADYDGWVRPEECPGPTPLGESTCDKFTISLTNPQGGQSTEATITYGTQVKKVTIAPGETKVVELSAGSETEATVEFTGWEKKYTVKYEKPANCGDLPKTGDNLVTYVASGTGIAGLGVLVFFLARRRLVKLRRMAS